MRRGLTVRMIVADAVLVTVTGRSGASACEVIGFTCRPGG
jgi:hypothetical protein